MGGETFIRVKFTFGAKCKLAKLDRTTLNTSLMPMDNLRKLIYKHFPEIRQTVVQEPSQTPMGVIGATQHLSVKCKDMVGDFITIENEEDLDAMEFGQMSSLEFCIDVIRMPFPAARSSSIHDRWGKSDNTRSNQERWGKLSDRQSDKADEGNHPKKMTQCLHFQSGFCRYGAGCRFAHDPAKRGNHRSSESLRAPFKIDWAAVLLELGYSSKSRV